MDLRHIAIDVVETNGPGLHSLSLGFHGLNQNQKSMGHHLAPQLHGFGHGHQVQKLVEEVEVRKITRFSP